MKTLGLWICFAIWLFHLLVGSSAAFAAWRLWPERKIRFIKATAFHLHAAMLDALSAIVLTLPFFTSGVHFTWTFSFVLFGFTLLRDIPRLPLILYILRGPSGTRDENGNGLLVETESSSSLTPEEWDERILRQSKAALRSEIKPEFLQ